MKKVMEIFETLDTIGVNTNEALERFMGDREMYLKYVRKFPQEPTMVKLKETVIQKDYEAAEKAVHALKGIAANLGFDSLTDASIDMLEELRKGNTEAALREFGNVQREYTRFSQAIEQAK